jgi:hypothetical protein
MQEHTRNNIINAIFKGVYYTVFFLTRTRIVTPVRLPEFSRAVGFFPAPVSSVKNILPSKKLMPVEHLSGITTVCLAAVEYRRAGYLDPYNEFSIAVPVQYSMSENNVGLEGYYILHLPVTTEQARWGGAEIFGLPKFVAEISFKDKGELCCSQLRADKKEIISLEVKKINTKHQSRDLFDYSVKDNRLLRICFHEEGEIGVTKIGGGASCHFGNHPIADSLRALEIGQVSAWHEYAPQLQGVMHPPKERFPL